MFKDQGLEMMGSVTLNGEDTAASMRVGSDYDGATGPLCTSP